MMAKRVLFVGLVVLFIGLITASGEPVDSHTDLVPRTPILILDDASFTAENGVVSGAGTDDDPYLIEGWAIDATGTDFGIRIEGTTKAFRIENCHIFGAKTVAIRLLGVSRPIITGSLIENGLLGVVLVRVERAIISENRFLHNSQTSILVLESSRNEFYKNRFIAGGVGMILHGRATNNLIHNNVFDQNRLGIRIFAGSDGNRIYRNDFLSCRAASYAHNRWDDGRGVGNYWSGYRGNDRDGDGIGDTSFFIFGPTYEFDHHPAMTPFHPEQEEERE